MTTHACIRKIIKDNSRLKHQHIPLHKSMLSDFFSFYVAWILTCALMGMLLFK